MLDPMFLVFHDKTLRVSIKEKKKKKPLQQANNNRGFDYEIKIEYYKKVEKHKSK